MYNSVEGADDDSDCEPCQSNGLHVLTNKLNYYLDQSTTFNPYEQK